MGTEHQCPRCGRTIPENSPEGVCPACAFEGALLSDSSVSPITDDTTQTPPPGDSGATVGRRGRFPRWLPAFLFAVVTIAALLRVGWSHLHVRPRIYLNETLQIQFDAPQYGVTTEDRLVEVNGTPVTTLDDVYPQYDRSESERVDFVFSRDGDGGETRTNVTWLRAIPPLEFEISEDGTLSLGAGLVAENIGLSPDERVVAVNNTAFADILAENLNPQEVFPANGEILYVTHFTTQRTGDPGSGREIAISTYSRKRYWARLLAGIALGIVGVGTFWLRPEARSAAGFVIFCSHLSLFWYVRAIPAWHRLPAENVLYYFLQCFLLVSGFLFVITFTPLRVFVKRVHLWLLPPLAAGAALAGINFALYPKYGVKGILQTPFFNLWAGSLLLMLLLVLPFGLWLRLGGQTLAATDRQRANVLRIALIAGFVPSTMYTFLMMPLDPKAVYLVPFEISIVLFPLLIGYAIVRHNLLQLGELARDGLLYGLLIFGIVLAYWGGTSLVLPLIESSIPRSETWFRPALFAGVLLVTIPVHGWARSVSSRRFNFASFSLEAFLQAMEEKERTSYSVDEYCHAAAIELSRITRTPDIALFTRHPGSPEWTLSAVTPFIESGTSEKDRKSLLEILEIERAEIHRDDILENNSYRPVREEALRGLKSLNASALFPLISRDKLIGAVSFGEKSSSTSFSAAELGILKRIVQHLGNVLFNFMGQDVTKAGGRIVDKFPEPPDRIGDYAIESAIGDGGMSHVFLGRRNGIDYAIKVANRSVQSNAVLLERFHREAIAIQRLDHPNIVSVTEVGWHGPEPYIVLEYFPDRSLSEQLKKYGPFSERDVLEIGIQTARGLAAAHDAGIVHRDIKPRNLFRSEKGELRIGDFGLAHLADRSTITKTGEFFGTPHYLSPEVIRGDGFSIQSDQYALGVTMYELLTGKRPFRGNSAHSIMYQAFNVAPPDPRDLKAEINDATANLIQKLMEKSPDARFSSYDELIEAFEHCIHMQLDIDPVKGE